MTDESRDAETPEDIVEKAKQESVDKAEITEEQQAHLDHWQALAEKAQGLLLSDDNLRQVVGAMLASRQLYAMALHDMDVRVDMLDEEEEEREQLKEVFISSAAKQAANPFDENELLQGVQETVIPWMEKVSKEHNFLEERTRRTEIQEAEVERRNKDVAIGVAYTQTELPEEDSDETEMDGVYELNRVRTLVLVGWKPAVLWVINHILEYVTSPEAFASSLAPKQTVVLARTAAGHKDARVMTLGEKAWENCARSNEWWGRTFQESYLDKLKDPMDLFIVTDLAHAREGHSFQSPMAKAADAQKRLRKWATKMGSAFIGGVLLDSKKLPEFNTPIWEQLRMFTYLRAVGVEVRDDGDYDLIIGRHHRISGVAKAEIEAFTSSDIITP
jgi:hypothetical protein|tara:strand:- start:4944 stop:6107 length:1164 start_codon:yes stop_codon:yes gene_type:complete